MIVLDAKGIKPVDGIYLWQAKQLPKPKPGNKKQPAAKHIGKPLC